MAAIIKQLLKSDDPEDFALNLGVEKLVKLLRKLSESYYNTGVNIVSDHVFDILRDTLEKIDPQNSFLKEVGAPVKGTKNKVKLPYPMGSLSKIKPGSNYLEKWMHDYVGPYILSDKLDGVSAQLYIDKDHKVFLYSRGEHIEGADTNTSQDISHLLNFILPKHIDTNKLPAGLCIRGEIIISKKNFTKIEKIMKNARSAVSGLVNSKKIDVTIANLADFITYSILSSEMSGKEQLDNLAKYGFQTAEHKMFKHINEDVLKEYLKERRGLSIYDIDGIVCQDESKTYVHTGEDPHFAFAFKMMFADQIAITQVVQVIWTPSSYKYIKPRIEIKPVELGGTTCTFATAFNAKFIEDNNIGPGAEIEIIRSGDVIPYILKVLKPATSGKPQMPTIDYTWNDTKVDIIADEVDETINVKIIEHFFKVMRVKWLSSGIITKLVENGYTSVSDILNAEKDDLIEIEGIGEKLVDKIFDEIDKSFKEAKLETFMAASHTLGRALGERKLAEIVKIYPNILENKWSQETFINKIIEVDGFSDKLATLFVENFKEFKKFYKSINKIYDISHFENVAAKIVEKDSDIFQNKNIVFTGFRDKELEKFIVDNGGKITTSVSGKTFMLVYVDGDESSKKTKAAELGIKMITKTDFMNKYVKKN